MTNAEAIKVLDDLSEFARSKTNSNPDCPLLEAIENAKAALSILDIKNKAGSHE